MFVPQFLLLVSLPVSVRFQFVYKLDCPGVAGVFSFLLLYGLPVLCCCCSRCCSCSWFFCCCFGSLFFVVVLSSSARIVYYRQQEGLLFSLLLIDLPVIRLLPRFVILSCFSFLLLFVFLISTHGWMLNKTSKKKKKKKKKRKKKSASFLSFFVVFFFLLPLLVSKN